MSTAAELEIALGAARAAILGSRDPALTARRLCRWATRECAFALSPASLSEDELVNARTTGINVAIFAGSSRRHQRKEKHQ